MRQGFGGNYKRLLSGIVLAISLGVMSGGCAWGSDGSGSSAKRMQGMSSVLPKASWHQVHSAMTVEELVSLSGNPCDSPISNSKCMNDEDDIEFVPDCDARDFRAVVSRRRGAILLNRVPPRHDMRVKVLPYGQEVCVQGVARIGVYPAYLFVTADLPTTVGSPRCKQIAPGRFEGACATGWVDRDDMKLLGNTK
jgi:hypothetical protein